MTVNLIAGDDDLGDSDLVDIENDDGDVEEVDYISCSGEAQLVSRSVLQSRAASEEDADEPALGDSLLLLDEDLCELELDEIELSSDMEFQANEVDDDDHSSLSSRSSGEDLPSYSPPATKDGGASRNRRGRGQGRGGRVRGRGQGRGRVTNSSTRGHGQRGAGSSNVDGTVQEEWIWEFTYTNDSSILSPSILSVVLPRNL